jgi:hypothetical protein
MGMATTEADYALEIGGVFEYRAQDAERIARQRGQQGLPPTKAPKSLPVLSTKDLALKEAESLFACAEKWMTISCAGGNRASCSERLDRLRFSVSNFYWLTSSNYAYMPPQNYAVAMEWAHKGAQAGYVQSMKDLGQYYLDGRLVEKSSAEAFRWLKAAAEGGCKPAMTLVARMYEQGDGTQKDRLQAAFWATLGWGLMPSGLSRTELAEVQNLATAWTPSKDAKGKCIEPAAQASSGSLPKAEVIGSVPGNPQIIVDNATEYAITVSLAGPTTQTVIIPAGQSRTVTVAQGGYGVTATSSGPGVIPLSGNETYSAGLQYRVRYFLSPK